MGGIEIFYSVYIRSSEPVVMAKASRSGKAYVASHIANKIRCATKAMWYYGVKLHIVTKCTYKGLPMAWGQNWYPDGICSEVLSRIERACLGPCGRYFLFTLF